MTNAGILQFSGEFCSGEVQALAAMLGPVEFRIGSRRTVSPFAVAPWANDQGADYDALPGVLKKLRGDWACVPFGMTTTPLGLPADWLPQSISPASDIDPLPHGFGSNHTWELRSPDRTAVHAVIDYPAHHPIAKLERTVRARPGCAAVDISLTVHPRAYAKLPVGLHPTFRLPSQPRAARLEFGGGDVRAWTYPIDAEPGRSRFRANQRDVPLHRLEANGGGTIDIQNLPFDGESEDIVLLTRTGGHVELVNNDEMYRTTLEWNSRALPSCLLWLSNFGRQFYPWSGRFRAIGIEPIAAPFDLRLQYRDGKDPIAATGISTSIEFKANIPWTTSYSISCAEL